MVLPLIFATLGSIRAWGILHAFDVYHRYFVRLEKEFQTSGWDTFLGDETRRNIGTSRVAWLLWAIIDLTTLFAAILFGTPLSKYVG